ncbi:MAG: hypothetical protein AAGC55_27370 [Myxococcota bacterium]
MAFDSDSAANLSCGLYKTIAPLPDREDEVAAGLLVYFHNHSVQGPPLLLLPWRNVNNKWQFHERGYLITDAAYLATLEALRREGFYRLREPFHPKVDQIVDHNALVQLGYNRQAEPILFFPTLHPTANSLVFPNKGVKIALSVCELLEPIDLRGPHTPEPTVPVPDDPPTYH